MTSDREQQGDFRDLYRQAFRDYGARALWNSRALDRPTADDALAVARALRIHGDRAARFLAEQLERACRAAL